MVLVPAAAPMLRSVKVAVPRSAPVRTTLISLVPVKVSATEAEPSIVYKAVIFGPAISRRSQSVMTMPSTSTILTTELES